MVVLGLLHEGRIQSFRFPIPENHPTSCLKTGLARRLSVYRSGASGNGCLSKGGQEGVVSM